MAKGEGARGPDYHNGCTQGMKYLGFEGTQPRVGADRPLHLFSFGFFSWLRPIS